MTDNLDLLTGKALELLNKVEAGIINVTPHAAELVLNVVRVDSIQALVIALGFAVMAVAGVILGKKIHSNAIALKGHYEKENRMGAAVFIWLVSAGCWIVSFIFIANVWNWVGVLHPELRLAKDLYDSMLGDKYNDN